MKFILIRHGKTRGNLERRYIGCRSDEPLCPEGIAGLEIRSYPEADRVFSSPMQRCLQTAGIIYSGKDVQVIDELRECDFGSFEGRNYAELKDDAAYLEWLESGGELPFPGGEGRSAFCQRCISAFRDAVSSLPEGSYAFVVHGGTIMAVMEHFARPAGGYYDFQVQNGGGYILNGDGSYMPLE